MLWTCLPDEYRKYFSPYFRESASIYVCKYLIEEGARVTIYDPKVEEEQVYM